MEVFRSPNNPIIAPKDVKPSRPDFEVVGVFNAGVARLDEQVLLLLRIAERPISAHPDTALVAVYDVAAGGLVLKEFSKKDAENDFSDPRFVKTPAQLYLTSISHLRLARSKDGIKFEIEDSPAIAPENDYETFGVEDPRISFIDGTYYISYVAVSPFGVTTCLASTKDFLFFSRHGVIACPDNKDVILFPARIDGKYYALQRPVSDMFDKFQIWISESPDMICWGNHRYLMGPRRDLWDCSRVGGSAVPCKTDAGWLTIYHAADKDSRYCLGAVLLDGRRPWKIIARAKEAIFEPQTDYECSGFFENVVFSCGLLCEDGRLKIYYGAADTTLCYAELAVQDVFEVLNL